MRIFFSKKNVSGKIPKKKGSVHRPEHRPDFFEQKIFGQNGGSFLVIFKNVPRGSCSTTFST